MSVSIDRARAILGVKVLGPEQAMRHFGVTYTPEQLAAFQEVSFSEETLRDRAGTHLLVAGAPLSVLDIRNRHPELFYNRKPAWYDREAEQSWAAAPVEARWYLLRKGSVPRSQRKTFDEQRALLAPGEVVARACEVTFAVILHFLATGEYLLHDWVRCQDTTSYGERVVVGYFDEVGFSAFGEWDGCRVAGTGLASARKS